jgi:EpsI family protein
MRTRPFIAIILMLSATALADRYAQTRPASVLAASLTSIDRVLGDWRAIHDQTLSGPVLERLVPTDYVSRVYQKREWNAALLITYFSQQRAGETMHSPEVCLPGSGWEILKRDTATMTSGGAVHEVNKHHIQNAGRRMLVLYWYQSGSRVIRSEYLGKLLLIEDSILKGRTDGALVRLIVPDAAGAGDQAIELASLVIPRLQRLFAESS